ncbi:MAG: hypothetical protein IJO83_08305 [Clostridia bacterium]|nr:hypothetical protein [Clostridia bacterium]
MTLKKVLAFAVALAMVMSMIPAGLVAFAEEGSVVATIGDVEYTSLTEAMAAVDEMYDTDAIEVTLLKNSSEDFVLEYGVAVLNTNGNSYSGTATVGGVLIADCELENVVCTLKGASYDKTKFGYAGLDAGVETVEGAQVRIGGGKSEGGKVVGEDSGLRFVAKANLSDTLAAIAYGFFDAEEGKYAEGYEIGVKLSAEGSDSSTYVPATLWQEEGKVFTAALTNLKESNYNRRYTAKAYVTVEGVVFEDVKTSTRSIYQVASGLLSRGESAEKMSDALLGMLNAYVNQTGVRLTLTDAGSLDARLSDKTGGYTGDAFFTVGDTTYKNGKYAVTLEAIGKSIIDTRIFNEYVRINNNNSKVSPVTGVKDNGDGSYTVTFDYADIDGKTSVINEAVSLTSGKVTAVVPEGVQFTGSADKLSIVLKTISEDKSAVEAGEGEELNSFDIHVMGIAEGNVTPVIVTFSEMAEKGLNRGNLRLYHVEDGVNVEMEQVEKASDLKKHNQFTYDPVDGTVVMALASFSEVAVVSDTENAWNGEFDYTWYTANDGVATVAEGEADYVIANADQLAAFGAIVGGMAKDEEGNAIARDSFAGKTVKLVSDINIGDDEEHNNANVIFYPIGYYCNENYTFEDKTTGVYSTVYSFEGEFDGNGHTISNFYQNTWEMTGDYNSGYPEGSNHYKDAMGLFGYVVNGKVCNLTVDNFSSDGEFTPTGVIAAFSENSEFENIAITNCNPRVYNTGNGGIVGIGGVSSDTSDKKLTFTNITIDNTNKISALWGSWDVACGGLMGMFRGYSKVEFTNCHVAAQIDAYNDVCGNYQYYWYRYSGMMIGSLRGRNTTDTQGYTVPDMTDITAEGCTVHFGTWNDYYYCELVANSIASYTHDHQFSRLTQIASLDEIKSGDTWTKTGNFLLISGDTKTCYHIVKDTDGTLKQHLHTAAGYEESIDEDGDGNVDLKEDKTIVYLPFKQLFQGDGWGVKHVPIYDDGTGFDGITILDRQVADSVKKFDSVIEENTELQADRTIKVGTLFKKIENLDEKVAIQNANVQVTVSPVGEESTAGVTYEANTEDWTQGTLVFTGEGKAKITITDYYFCTPTTITVNVTERQPEEKFDKKFNKDFLYRVGNVGTVTLGTLFEAKEGATIGTVDVEVENISGTEELDVYTKSSTWTNGTLDFADTYTGVVKVTIKDDDKYCKPTELYLEVVDATNITAKANATDKNVVLLNDTSGGFTVSNGYSFYGNGFKVTCAGDGSYRSAAVSYGFVTVDNGTIDNVQIICDIFPKSYLYTTEMSAGSDGRYPYGYSAVIVTGDSIVSNSYIYGARNNIQVGDGNVVIENTVTECGSLSNIHIKSNDAYTVTLDDITTIQYQTTSSYDASAKVLGFGVAVGMPDSTSNANVKLKGDLRQYNWVTEADKSVSNSYAVTAINSALKETTYQHTIAGATAVNMGIAFLNDLNTNIKEDDARDNRDEIPYVLETITINGKDGQVYSIASNSGITTDERYDAEKDGVLPYIAEVNGLINPVVSFGGTSNDALVVSKAFTNGKWTTTLSVDLDNIIGGSYDFKFSDLIVKKYGKDLEFTVVDANNNTVDKDASIKLNQLATSEYTLVATDNLIYDAQGEKINTSAECSLPFVLKASKTSIPDPVISGVGSGTSIRLYESSWGTEYWRPAYDVLTGVKISYWSASEGVTKNLNAEDLNNAGTTSGNVWTYTCDDYTFTITGGAVHSDGTTITPKVVDGKLYFASMNKHFGTGTTTRDIILTYEFKDNNASDKEEYKGTAKYDTEEVYEYKDFNNGSLVEHTSSSSGGSSPCVTPDTLVTLADGSQQRIDSLTGDEILKVWDFETGDYTEAPIAVLRNHGLSNNTVITMEFDNGIVTKAVNAHGYYDADARRFVEITGENAENYAGHSFVVETEDGYTTAVLEKVTVEEKEVEAWSILTANNYNFIADGVFSITSSVGGLEYFMPYENDENLKIDAAKKQADIEKYGLFTYDEFKHILTEEQFEAINMPQIKVSVGKGYITMEDLMRVIEVEVLSPSRPE